MILAFARRWTACLSSALIGLAAAPAWPATTVADPVGVVTLSQALAATLVRNPDLETAGYELKAGDARTLQAGLRPNPDLSLSLEDFAGTGETRGTRALQTTLSLSQSIELGGKRPRRVDVATSERDLLGIEQQARELDVLAETTRRFIDVVTAQERLRLARSTVELVERTRKEIAARVSAARSPQAELSRASIAVSRAQLDARQAQAVLDGARRSLAAMWGASEVQFDRAQADLFALPQLEPLESLLTRLQRNPNFTRFATQARLREAELRLTQANSRPNLTVGVGLRRYQLSRDTALVAEFAIALPVFDRSQGRIAEAAVRRTQSQAEERAARIRAQATLYALYQQVQVSRQQLSALRGEALPQAQAVLEQTQAGYERGRFSYLELATAQQELLSLQAALIDAAADAHRFASDIERLTSEPVIATP